MFAEMIADMKAEIILQKKETQYFTYFYIILFQGTGNHKTKCNTLFNQVV